MLRGSGRFAEDRYRAELDDLDTDPVEDYLTVGAEAGRSPHPLYDRRFHLEGDRSARRTTVDPFVHFLAGAARRGVPVHPLFDADVVVARHPEAHSHPQGPWGWYLDQGDREIGPAVAWLPDDAVPSPSAHVALVREVEARHVAVPDHTDVPRSFATFDHERGSAHVAAMAEVVAGMNDPPTVSVVIPTKDRAHVLAASLDSALGQSYPHLEILVVDDGSIDDTPRLLLGYDDPRLRVLTQANAGVAAARNHGLREARGRLVTYLDSDNTWVPEFVETMVGTLAVTQARAAYAASELRAEDRVEYRGRPFDREVLAERNYIDCITLVHERALVDEVGGFDEKLRRVVDWDLLNRLAAVTDLVYAPFVATSYDVWDEGEERITLTESIGYRYEVRAKQLVDWAAAPRAVGGRTSILVVIRRDDDPDLEDVADFVDAHRAAAGDVEVVLVDNGTPRATALRLRALEVALEGVRVERLATHVSRAAAVDVAATRATGDVLVVAELDTGPTAAAALAACAADVRAGRAEVVQPLWLDPDATIAAAGILSAADGTPVAVGAGLAVHDAAAALDVPRDAPDPFGYAVASGTFRRVEGLAAVYVQGGAEQDLGRRLREVGATTVVRASAAVELSTWPLVQRHLLGRPDDRELRRRGATGVDTSLEPAVTASGDLDVGGLVPVPLTRINRRGPQRWGVHHVRQAGSRRRWAIKTAVSGARERLTWGDWHFAVALRDALERLGEHAVVDTRRAWYRATAALDDVDLALRGTQIYEPPPGRASLLWIISHPQEVTIAEATRFDHVFAASVPFAKDASRRWERPVTPLLQATDPRRFHTRSDVERDLPLLFVGNSRGVRRRIVADAIDAGLEPAIYGEGWEGMVPDRLIHGTHVPNELLGRYYASAEVVLADHWDDMRRYGFVANRIFDALASGAAVVSDRVPGLDGLFGGAVRTYTNASDLAEQVDSARSADHDPSGVAEHSFDARARALVAALDRSG